jgi:hypothetical protein
MPIKLDPRIYKELYDMIVVFADRYGWDLEKWHTVNLEREFKEIDAILKQLNRVFTKSVNSYTGGWTSFVGNVLLGVLKVLEDVIKARKMLYESEKS